MFCFKNLLSKIFFAVTFSFSWFMKGIDKELLLYNEWYIFYFLFSLNEMPMYKH